MAVAVAVVVAGVRAAVVVAAGAVAGAGDRGGTMIQTRRLRSIATLAGALLLGAAGVCADEAKPAAQRVFDSPEAAAKALIDAAAKNDDAALKTLFEPAARDLIQSGSDAIVAEERKDFAAAAKAELSYEKSENRVILVIGEDEWPLPFPLVKGEKGWAFDGEAGREELLMRRIGRNELRAISICRAYAFAQREYASEDRDGDGVREYARKVRSSPGKKDGLYWETKPGEPASPFGPLIESAEAALGGRASKGAPYGGYYWRILEGQGPKAPGGDHSYVLNGNMIAGFALVGFPADYPSSGVMTFLVSHHGKVLQKDLGENTASVVKRMIGFNPDKTWQEVTD